MTVTDIVIAVDHPAFTGHFPGMPIVPGVVLLDEALYAIADLSGVDLAHCTFSSVKFHNVVRPGQAVRLQFEFSAQGNVRFELQSADQPVATGTITLAARTRRADAV